MHIFLPDSLYYTQTNGPAAVTNAGKMCNGAKLLGGDACEGGLANARAETSALCLTSSLASIEFRFPVACDSTPILWKSRPLSGTGGHSSCSHTAGSWLLWQVLVPKNTDQSEHLLCLAQRGRTGRRTSRVFLPLC